MTGFSKKIDETQSTWEGMQLDFMQPADSNWNRYSRNNRSKRNESPNCQPPIVTRKVPPAHELGD